MRTPARANLQAAQARTRSTEARPGQTIRQLHGCSGAISSPLYDLETDGGRTDARASCPPAPDAPLGGVPPGRCAGRGGHCVAMAAPGPSCSALLGPAAKAPPLAEPGPFPGTRSRRCGFQTCDGGCSWSSRPVCCSLPKRRYTAPLPHRATD